MLLVRFAYSSIMYTVVLHKSNVEHSAFAWTSISVGGQYIFAKHREYVQSVVGVFQRLTPKNERIKLAGMLCAPVSTVLMWWKKRL